MGARRGGGGARVGGRPPLENQKKIHHMGGLFLHLVVFLLFFTLCGGLNLGLPTLPTKISAGAHACDPFTNNLLIKSVQFQ